MFVSNALLGLLATVSVADARPQSAVLGPNPLDDYKFEGDHVVDFEKACKKYPPPADECALIIAGGITWSFAPEELAIENGSADQLAVLTFGGCDNLYGNAWEPQSPGFKTSFEIRSGKIEAETGWIGPNAIDKPKVTRDGEELDVECEDSDSISGGNWGLDAGFYRVCHFSYIT